MKSTAAKPSIGVRSGDGGMLSFEVKGACGEALATSAPCATIGRLESALATLGAAVSLEWKSTSGLAADAVLSVGRRRVPLSGSPSHAQIALAIEAAAVARIVDQRPEKRRRQDLSGLRCDLSR